ncbi:helix-turn-helix domain-containing protein [Flammeovirga aprica]|uniref:Helix-turn-helix transcriptional regulator n=1 Tax=Flammeovirga aprica JL-4 TaxID=694437 RepID=A0A7X9P335_9BACT|nr:AraC family transcriptional regulator [Flammeovirga aprica]NME68530.1 helix-turn-helix transcriptional regulator [Flammeovirga aprica JL-4]
MHKLEGDDITPQSVYKYISDIYGGNWNGESMVIENEKINCKATYFNYPNDIIVGLVKLKCTERLTYESIATDKKDYLTIRIGYQAVFDEKNNQKAAVNKGIFIYDVNFLYENHLHPDIWYEWFAIKCPIDFLKTWFIEDTDFDDFKNRVINSYIYCPFIPEIETIIRELSFFNEDDKLKKTIFLSKLFEILGRLFTVLKEQRPRQFQDIKLHPEDYKTMLDVREYILEDFSRKPKLEEIAKEFHLSVSKLRRDFSSVYQTTVMKFFDQHRLQEAYQQIKYSDKSITAISIDLGFVSVAHFGTAFKKEYKITPNQLRNKDSTQNE